MKYIETAVLTNTKGNFDTFTYSVSKETEIKPGQIVKVPFRNRDLYAVILNETEKPGFKTKKVDNFLDITLPAHLIEAAKWMSKYYYAPIHTVFRTILPSGFYKKRRSDHSAVKSPLTKNRASANLILNPDQKRALEKIEKSGNDKPFLLYGITGSGKTEIYLRLIEEGIKNGRGAIVLVPEVALTPQTIQRFEERFSGQVTVLHSYLKETERQRNWNALRNGEKKIVVGSRSALFAPLDNLGLIVVDEEHENSYKQEQTPKYDTIKTAQKIAEFNKAKLVLGSATPSIESYFKAQKNEYILLNLYKRANGSDLPNVEIIDLRKEFKGGNKSIISLKLQDLISETLANQKQTILFLNRRGTASYVFCRDCGYIEKCPDCEIPLTYHGMNNILLCHHCNLKKTSPVICPDCKGAAIKYLGVGTHGIELEIKRLFPEAKIIRMDKDTTKERESYEKIYNDFRERKFDILIGTQMIAKGWDIPNVDLIGIILADIGLNFPDFRSGEKVFQLLTQVAGRSGRGENPGRVIIQTYNPENTAVIFAKKHDFQGFYSCELESRKMLKYPPFSKIIKLIYEDSSPKNAENEAKKLSDLLRKEGFTILGPSPSYILRLKGRYRWQILIKDAGKKPIDLLKFIPKAWSIDIDPKNTI